MGRLEDIQTDHLPDLSPPPFTEQFFGYARERQSILLRRRGQMDLTPSGELTDDPVLQEFRFCNIFREDDRVTEWFREYVRDPLQNKDEVVFATVAFRFFNTIKTGHVMRDNHLLTRWSPKVARQVLGDLKPLITGAYMVKTPLRKPKLEGLIEILDNVWADRETLVRDIRSADRLEVAHQRLTRYPWIGGFMAYEFVTDLRHTEMLSDAVDIHSWANPGPGAMRGISRVLYGVPDRRVKERDMLLVMRSLLRASKDMWPSDWPEWEMREVEHTLCEFDKYMRAVQGEGRPKQRYQPYEEKRS